MYLYYKALWSAVRNDIKLREDKNEILIYYLVLLLIGTGFIFSQIIREKYIYYWDYSGYWTLAIDMSKRLFESPIEAMQMLYYSINYDEYNRLLPILIAVPMKFLGNSFLAYTLITYMFFGCPAIFLIALTIEKYTRKILNRKISLKIAIICTATMPLVLHPILNGYIDIGGVLTLSALTYISLDLNWEKFDIKQCFCMAILLLLTLFQRRYYAFAVIGYVAGILVNAIDFLLYSKNKKIILKNCSTFLSVVGGICTGVLVIFFSSFLFRNINNNFATAYSAYSVGNVWWDITNTIRYIGWIFLILLLIGLVITTIKTKFKMADTYMLIINIIVPLFLFFRIQSLGMQHYYIITCPLIVLAVSSIFLIEDILSSMSAKVIVSGLLIVCWVSIFVNSYSVININNPLYSSIKYEPKIRGDLHELNRINSDVLNLTNNEDGKVYVIGSSDVFNDDILRKINYPDAYWEKDCLLPASHVDLRDGFPMSFFQAKYVLVGEPAQTHLPTDTQQVVTLLADEFIHNGPISEHFEYIMEYKLDKNVVVKLYKKISEFTKYDIQYLINLYDISYFEYPELFSERLKEYECHLEVDCYE